MLLTLIILTMVWSQSGFVIWQTARNIHYRYERMRELSNAKDTLVMTRAEAQNLTWVKDDEIRYKGRMFDIKVKTAKDGCIVFIGHYDGNDDNLFSRLSDLVSTHENDPSKTKISFWICEGILTDTKLSLSVSCPDENTVGSIEPPLISAFPATPSLPPKDFIV